MIVLRFTAGDVSQEVRSECAELVIGSDPTADVTLDGLGLAGRAVRLRREDSQVEVEILGGQQRLRMRVGDEIEVGPTRLALVGLLPMSSEPAMVFGGYDDDPAARPSPRFELAEAGSPPAPFGPRPASTPPALRADEPRPGVPPPASSRPSGGAAAAAARLRASAGVKGRAGAGGRSQGAAERAAQLKPLKFPEPDFGTELVTQLKRSPFFALSLGFHLLVFFIMSLFHTSPQESLRTDLGAMSASLDAADEELSRKLVDERDDGLDLREPEIPDMAEVIFEEEKPPSPKPQAPPPSPFKEDPPDDDRRPLEIGVMPGLNAARARVPGKTPQVETADLKRDFQRGLAGASNQRSAEIVRGQLGRGRGGHASLEELLRSDVLVVDGSFDHIEKVLDALHIQYVKKSPWGLSAPVPEDFTSYKIVFWNCGEALTKSRTAAVAKHLRTFVQDGGYLMTTDWGVANVLEAAFPGYLRTNGNRAHLPEMTLPIEAAASARDHPLLEGVFLPNVQGKWWLEQAAFDVAVGRKDKVTVLIESPMLRDTLNRSPVVAATFHHGRGRVLHMMGHYFQEAGNLAGTISAHRLALNFVLMRLDQDRSPRRR